MRNIFVKLFGPDVQRCRLKKFLFLTKVVICNQLCNLIEVHYEEHFCEIRVVSKQQNKACTYKFK